MNKIMIIGGGLGGLSAAITLASKGYDVHLFEKNNHLGGKLKRVANDQYQFDFGPNTITMPHVFQNVILNSGANPDDYFQFIKLDVHTRNHYGSGDSFELTTNTSHMIEQLKELDAPGAANYREYLHEVKRLYQLSVDHFLYYSFSSKKDYANPSLAKAFLKVRPFENLDHFHRRYFQNEKVIQAFNRYATYVGSSPYLTPATFAMIAHLELAEGVFYAKGGNASIADGLVKRAKELGVSFHLSTDVKEVLVKNKRAVAIRTSQDTIHEGDAFVMNGDILSAYQRVVKEQDRPHFTNKKINSITPSISAFVILAGISTKMEKLIHHQVYFSNQYEDEFRELFTERKMPSDPTIYISNSSYTDKSQAPNGSNLFILVNAPAISESYDEEEIRVYKEIVYKKLATYGLNIEPHLEFEQVVTPKDISTQFRAYKGALYGPSSHSFLGAFLRPQNRSKDIPNLYFTGGSTHPGGGSPMVMISGQNVAKLVDHQLKGLM
ncbi:phytoene desaturase family protein [Bacillus alkalicellulosilyticus]|uniref:phytoene desaturase family protein n=1 Tax=Alkalihalobacterium alkalicellulosilyticum TaxID=1912214 RepID=UPI0009976829|nr:phytoene desaturase family protein [Bacillus alkalicellulosilyticus]